MQLFTLREILHRFHFLKSSGSASTVVVFKCAAQTNLMKFMNISTWYVLDMVARKDKTIVVKIRKTHTYKMCHQGSDFGFTLVFDYNR